MLDLAANAELVEVAGTSVLAYPRGRHQALSHAPIRATVCVAARDAAVNLDRALASLFVQTFREMCVVVVDDASRDSSFSIACRFAAQNDNVVVYQNPQRLGAVETTNRCFDLALGDYVKILHPDDFLLPDFMQIAVASLDADPDAVLVRCARAVMQGGQMREDPYFPSSCALIGTSALIHTLAGDNLAGPFSDHLVRRQAVQAERLRLRPELGGGAELEFALHLFARGDFLFRREPMVIFDRDAHALAPAPRAHELFAHECAARLSALRTLSYDVDARTLIRINERFCALYNALRERAADEGDERALERVFGEALDELARRLRRVSAAEPRALVITASSREVTMETTVEALLRAADAEASAQRYPQAEVPIRQILANAPWHIEALNDLGVLRYHQADLAGARKYLASVLELDPGNAIARENLAMLG